MRKKIHKNLVGIAALAIILTIGLTFWAYFMMLQKQMSMCWQARIIL